MEAATRRAVEKWGDKEWFISKTEAKLTSAFRSYVAKKWKKDDDEDDSDDDDDDDENEESEEE